MAENTKIEWTALRLSLAKLTTSLIETLLARGATIVGEELVVPGYTFNPWIGCAKVSPGCANCYAAQQDKFRHWTPEGWGKGKPRKRTSPANWKQVERWNREAGELGIRPRVFCASLADWLDDEVPIEWLADFLALVRRCKNLDFLLLTKRPENWRARLEAARDYAADALHRNEELCDWCNEWIEDGTPPANVWLGTTVEDQKRADERIPHLLRIPARVRFLSCEPLLGSLEIGEHLEDQLDGGYVLGSAPIHWVICGGESGPGARPMHPDWARSLRDQCAEAGVAFFFKQWGEWAPFYDRDKDDPDWREVPEESDSVQRINLAGGRGFHGERVVYFRKQGKKAAGRLLDGREHNEFPEAAR